MNRIIPVILCGGSGTRLWPLSRTQTPKQFLRLMDNMTLLQKTVQRSLNITQAPESNLVTVTLSALKAETVNQLNEISSELSSHVLGEPCARNTAAAIAYATHYVKRHFGDESIMWIMPSDHFVGDENELQQALKVAANIAKDDYLVTFGIKPTRAETGYGYILQSSTPIHSDNSKAFGVEKFVEKPDLETAMEFVKSGQYLWNSGMHVFKTRTVIDHFLEHSPAVYSKVGEAIALGTDDRMPDKITYELIGRREPFEKAVMEKTAKAAVIPTDLHWSDIGSFESLWEIRAKNRQGNTLDGKVVCHETENSMILSQDRLVTCIGMKDIVVIETSDSILVANKKCSDSLKSLVSTLQKLGRQETEISSMTSHNWGRARFISETSEYRLRDVTVNPGKITEQKINHDTY